MFASTTTFFPDARCGATLGRQKCSLPALVQIAFTESPTCSLVARSSKGSDGAAIPIPTAAAVEAPTTIHLVHLFDTPRGTPFPSPRRAELPHQASSSGGTSIATSCQNACAGERSTRLPKQPHEWADGASPRRWAM